MLSDIATAKINNIMYVTGSLKTIAFTGNKDHCDDDAHSYRDDIITGITIIIVTKITAIMIFVKMTTTMIVRL